MKKIMLTLLFLVILGLAACASPAPQEPAAVPNEVPSEAEEPSVGLDTEDETVQEEELFDETEIADDFATW